MKVSELEQRVPSGVELLHVILRHSQVHIALARTGNLSIAYVANGDAISTFTCSFPTEGSVPLEIETYRTRGAVEVNKITYHQEHERYQLLEP